MVRLSLLVGVVDLLLNKKIVAATREYENINFETKHFDVTPFVVYYIAHELRIIWIHKWYALEGLDVGLQAYNIQIGQYSFCYILSIYEECNFSLVADFIELSKV